ncbi:MAG: uroporphyrinogen decarboxylase family protein, partial [Myxococcota bacterium]
DALRVIDPEEGLSHVIEGVALIRKELDGKTPLIGFAGAPFTVASYLIEGGKSRDYRLTKNMMWSEPEAFSKLMGKLSEVTKRYLRAQVKAGAQAIQLFDSWAGSLSVDDYVTHVKPHVSDILRDIMTLDVPVIHFGVGTGHLLVEQKDAGGTVIGVDWRTPLDAAWDRLGDGVAVQGNLDPLLLCAPKDIAVDRAHQILRSVNGRPGHIFNLGHGIIPQTPVETVQAVVEAVHRFSE